MMVPQPGDILLLEARKNNWLSALIVWFSALWSHDLRASHDHCAIIVDADGRTFETSADKTGFFNIHVKHRGRRGQIWRWKDMTHENFDKGMNEVIGLEGETYPFWRLPMFMVNMADRVKSFNLVCSELVAKFLKGAGALPWRDYHGVNPDDLNDYFRRTPGWEMVYNDVVL